MKAVALQKRLFQVELLLRKRKRAPCHQGAGSPSQPGPGVLLWTWMVSQNSSISQDHRMTMMDQGKNKSPLQSYLNIDKTPTSPKSQTKKSPPLLAYVSNCCFFINYSFGLVLIVLPPSKVYLRHPLPEWLLLPGSCHPVPSPAALYPLQGHRPPVQFVLWVCLYNSAPGSVSVHSGPHVHAQSCPTLCDPMDCSPPGSSIHGILQAKIL